MTRWYVAMTEPQQEERAEKHAVRLGVEAFLPYVNQPIKVCNRSTHQKRVAFPGYLFVKFATGFNWQKVLCRTQGFSRFLGSDSDGLESLRDDVIEEIKSRSVDGVIQLDALKSVFSDNQRVRMARGLYADMKGVVLSSADQRVTVLLQLFNRSLVVVVDDSLVVAA